MRVKSMVIVIDNRYISQNTTADGGNLGHIAVIIAKENSFSH
jgi:hypothetical protein